jgi:hypothetical protein
VASVLDVSFSEPADGWITLRLEAPGQEYADSFSHIYPALEQLCGALCDLATGVAPRRVTFLLEPNELEVTFSSTEDDRAALGADLYPDHRRHPGARSSRAFAFTDTRSRIILQFWRALRRLQTSLPPPEFERAWREPFPEVAMASLTDLVNHIKPRAP